jgi:hypothetical protein
MRTWDYWIFNYEKQLTRFSGVGFLHRSWICRPSCCSHIATRPVIMIDCAHRSLKEAMIVIQVPSCFIGTVTNLHYWSLLLLCRSWYFLGDVHWGIEFGMPLRSDANVLQERYRNRLWWYQPTKSSVGFRIADLWSSTILHWDFPWRKKTFSYILIWPEPSLNEVQV